MTPLILFNRNSRPSSLQISKLTMVPEGNYTVSDYNFPVLIKNITEDNITLEIELADNKGQYISTTIYPGWNPELVTGIKNAPRDSLQVGN